MEILYLGLRIVLGLFHEFCHQSLLVIFAVHEKSIVHKYLQQQNMYTNIHQDLNYQGWIESHRAPPLSWVGTFRTKLQQNYRHQSKTPGWADFWAM